MRRLLARCRMLGRDRRGVSAVEFALIAPLLLLIFFGMAELSQGMMAQRRVSHAASAIGDLVAQSDASGVTQANLDDIFSVAGTILTPFPAPPLSMRVMSVTADASGNPKVDWSDLHGSGFPKPAQGSPVTLPTGLVTAAGENVIVAETKYQYTPVVGFVLKNGLTFNEVFYLRPRQVAKVPCSDCI